MNDSRGDRLDRRGWLWYARRMATYRQCCNRDTLGNECVCSLDCKCTCNGCICTDEWKEDTGPHGSRGNPPGVNGFFQWTVR